MVFALLAALAASPAPAGALFTAEGESAARLATGISMPSTGSNEATARAWLAEHGAAIGLTAADALVVVKTGEVVTFERRRAGVAVLQGEVKVSFDADGTLTMVHAGDPVPAETRGAFFIDVARAEQVAARGLTGVQLLEARPFWRRDGDHLSPVFVVRFTVSEPAFDVQRAIIDGATGKLQWRASEKLSAGMGSVYDISPAKGPVVTRALGGLAANATSLAGSRAIGRDCNGAGTGAGCSSRATANASGDFVSTPNPLVGTTDRFAEVMGYYQSDRFSAWVTGLDPAVTLPVIDVFTNVGNSNQGFFLGSSPLGGGRFGIELGQGPKADWAYEGDVIFHELGHGVVERTAQFGFYGLDGFGLAGEGGSLNEGAADCLSFGFGNDPVLGEFIGGYLQDAGNLTTPYLRRADDVFTCQGWNGNLDGGNPGRFGEIHDDGRILGSFFWALHTRTQSLGATAASRAFVRALNSVASTASFHDVTLAMQQHMATLYGAPAGELVSCLQCERDMAGCDPRTRRMYAGETHESRLLGSDSSTGAMGNGERPSTFQYELAVPANTVLTFDRFAITDGALPKVYARFGSKVSWANGNPTFDNTITAQGQTLPGKPAAGSWFLQGTLTDPGGGTRRYGMRAQFSGGVARPPAANLTCALGSGSGAGSCTCMPQCTGRTCGGDGCGGTCGTCSGTQVCGAAGSCVCAPQCAGRGCGPDGCGGTCGTCATGTCNMTSGVCEGCMPQCTGKQCGPNGCGQACGQCTGDDIVCELSTGQCVDAGQVEPIDSGTGGGTSGTGGGTGGGGDVQGTCGCSGAAPGVQVVLLALAGLLGRRRRESATSASR